MRDGGAYGCAVPRAYANLNPGLVGCADVSMVKLADTDTDVYTAALPDQCCMRERMSLLINAMWCIP